MEQTKNPKVIISGGVYDAGVNWSVFCYLCEHIVSETVRDPKELDRPLNIHRALHVKAGDKI
jgi:hypothetical protein